MNTQITTDKAERKAMPIFRGVLAYFPDALLEVAKVSEAGNQQHNAGQPLHWAKEKSTDEADCIVRHLLEADKIDTDGMLHAAKVAWRALALLQRIIDCKKSPTAIPPKGFEHLVLGVSGAGQPQTFQERGLLTPAPPSGMRSSKAS